MQGHQIDKTKHFHSIQILSDKKPQLQITKSGSAIPNTYKHPRKRRKNREPLTITEDIPLDHFFA
jgi:hypothetical protein